MRDAALLRGGSLFRLESMHPARVVACDPPVHAPAVRGDARHEALARARAGCHRDAAGLGAATAMPALGAYDGLLCRAPLG